MSAASLQQGKATLDDKAVQFTGSKTLLAGWGSPDSLTAEAAKKISSFGSFAEVCRFPGRAFLLWEGCVRQPKHYSWPVGFKQRWEASGYRGLLKARKNGPPRTAFTVAGGDYRKGYELAHLYAGSALRDHNLREDRHFTQSANLICMVPRLHRESEHDMKLLWLLRGLSFLRFRYDPLGAFSGPQPDRYGFVDGEKCEVFWP